MQGRLSAARSARRWQRWQRCRARSLTRAGQFRQTAQADDQAGKVVGHSGGIDRPRAAFGSGLRRTGFSADGHRGGVDLEQVVGRAVQRGAQRDQGVQLDLGWVAW